MIHVRKILILMYHFLTSMYIIVQLRPCKLYAKNKFHLKSIVLFVVKSTIIASMHQIVSITTQQ